MALRCPSEAALLLLVVSDSDVADTAVAEHARRCPECAILVRDLRNVAREIEALGGDTRTPHTPCLDELTLSGVVDNALGDTERRLALAHLVGCAHCRGQLAALAELLELPAIQKERATLEPVSRTTPWNHRRSLWAVAALAAAALLVVSLPPTVNGPAAHRGPTVTASDAPTLLAPTGDVTDGRVLRWTSVPNASQYRVTLYDNTAHVLFEARLTDTVLALPDSVAISVHHSYLWKVEVQTGWERWTSSDLIEFRVSGDAPAHEPRTLSPIVFSTSNQPRPGDSLRLRAARLTDSALIATIRSSPLEVREALAGTLALAVNGPPTARASELMLARRIATAYAIAWNDRFLVRQVERFAGWSSEQRQVKLLSDSLRRAAVTAYARDGVAPALALWKQAVFRAGSIADSAGIAASLGNIGAVLIEEGQSDSAAVYLDRARLLARAIGDLRVEANALSSLGALQESREDIGAARSRYGEAIALRNRIGDTRGLASDYNSLAGIARTVGDFAEARRQLESALAINRENGQPEFAATNLVNLAALSSFTGDFARADAQYRAALATWRERKQWTNVADALRGLGDLQLRRGSYSAAHATLVEALALYTRTGAMDKALLMRQALAGTRAAEGDLQGALDELAQAEQIADSARVGAVVRAGIALARADLATRMNTVADATRFYTSAIAQFGRAGDGAGEASARQGLALLNLAHDNAAGAQTLLAAALRTQRASGDQRAAALTGALLGFTALQRGDTLAARQLLAVAASDLKRLRDPVAAAATIGQQAELEAAAGFSAAAVSLYRSALATLADRTAPDVAWRLHAGLASVRNRQGGVADAANEFRAAISEIERSAGTFRAVERRSAYLTDKWDTYVQLASLERARGNVAAAFEVSEQVRASQMLEELASSRIDEPRDTAAPLVAREQDLRRRIAELTHGLEGSENERSLLRGPDVTRAGAVTRDALVRAQSDYESLLLELKDRSPRHAALVLRGKVSWRDVRQRLAPNEAMIEYLLSNTGSVAFVLTRDTLAQVDLATSRHDLAKLVDFVRGTLQPRGSPRLDSLWRAPLRQLHRDLIAPIEATGLLERKTRLTIVPHAELHYLPFAALLSGPAAGRFLIEHYQLAVTPSASVWLALSARSADTGRAGYVAFAPRPDVLPASRQEVAAIAELGMPNTAVFVGTLATEAAFRREAPGRRVIHLATYGVLNKQNPLFSFVELAAGTSDDGRLEAHEVFGLRLAADLVVLSACQTGLASGALSDVPAGDDWIGLVRAFLSAGAMHVMASLWPVQDRATALLMQRFYRDYTIGADPAIALAAAQRALLSSPATANPYYWAGFETVGGR